MGSHNKCTARPSHISNYFIDTTENLQTKRQNEWIRAKKKVAKSRTLSHYGAQANTRSHKIQKFSLRCVRPCCFFFFICFFSSCSSSLLLSRSIFVNMILLGLTIYIFLHYYRLISYCLANLNFIITIIMSIIVSHLLLRSFPLLTFLSLSRASRTHSLFFPRYKRPIFIIICYCH